MSDGKHTPGPWGRHGGIIAIIDESNIREKRVATVDLRLGTSEREANACLISASPEMLEAGRPIAAAAANWAEYQDDHYVDNDAMITVGMLRELRAAIAKAEGRS